MSAGAPWSVKGIDPKAREVAKDLARRSGMTLGEWLNQMIMEGDGEDDAVVPFGRKQAPYKGPDRRGRLRRLEDAYEGVIRPETRARDFGRDRGHERGRAANQDDEEEQLARVGTAIEALSNAAGNRREPHHAGHLRRRPGGRRPAGAPGNQRARPVRHR